MGRACSTNGGEENILTSKEFSSLWHRHRRTNGFVDLHETKPLQFCNFRNFIRNFLKHFVENLKYERGTLQRLGLNVVMNFLL
jgi:hypothetical protein